MKQRVLVIDDEIHMCKSLCEIRQFIIRGLVLIFAVYVDVVSKRNR